MSKTIIPRLVRSRNASFSTILAKWSLLLMVFLAIVLASPRKQAEAAANVRLCGDKLVKMVMALCKGCIQGTRMDVVAKRGLTTSDVSSAAGSSMDKRQHGYSPLANFYEEPRQTRRAGIATECCERMCSYSYLKSFCCESS